MVTFSFIDHSLLQALLPVKWFCAVIKSIITSRFNLLCCNYTHIHDFFQFSKQSTKFKKQSLKMYQECSHVLEII